MLTIALIVGWITVVAIQLSYFFKKKAHNVDEAIVNIDSIKTTISIIGTTAIMGIAVYYSLMD